MRENVILRINQIKGVHTLQSVMAVLNIDRTKAIKLLSSLRKKGYVKTKRLSNNKRVYEISPENRVGGADYVEILNKNSPIKISLSNNYKIHKEKVSLEEILVIAIKSKNFRQILASLGLFKKIHNWTELYRISKEENLNRKICALHELAKKIIKTRKITKRFENSAKPKKNKKYIYLIDGLNSKDFKDIEKKWKVYIPFNKSDLEDYK